MHLPLHPLQTDFPLPNAPAPPPSLFQSFWMAGFEAACHISKRRQRLDMLASTEHDRQALGDYRRLRELGFLTARDAVRWHLIDHAGRYDFSALEPLLEAALTNRVQVIWSLCHYGWPDDIDLFAPAFVERFAAYAHATAEFIKRQSDAVPFYCPINEISFLAWAAGEAGRMYPFCRGQGYRVKPQLIRAARAGIEAIRRVDPRARIVQTEPLINVVPAPRQPHKAHLALARTEGQFEAWELMQPFDIAGLNFYHDNQWQYPGSTRLRWQAQPRDPRYIPLHRLLAYFWQRYQRPLCLSETSHFGPGRAAWLRDIANEVRLARQFGVPVEGICLFPILDRPDWEDETLWHHAGLWDLHRNGTQRLERVLNQEYYAEFCRVRDCWRPAPPRHCAPDGESDRAPSTSLSD